jgi:hypothetical protein
MIKVLKVLSVCLCAAVCFVTAPLSMVQAQVTLTVGDGSGAVGSSGNSIDVSLNNPSENVRAVQLEICDVDDYLSSADCSTTARSSNFSCLANELESGCVRVVLISLEDGVIEEGNGPIFSLLYNVSSSAPQGECREVATENEQIGNDTGISLGVSSAPGEFCFTEATTTTTTGPPTTTTTINGNGCQNSEVRVECTDDDFCPGDECTTCTAVTECDGEVIDGTYAWELNDEVTGDTGDTIKVCPEDLDEGLNTLQALDTTNGAEGSKSLLLGGSDCTSECEIDVVQETVLRSRWLPSVAVITVNGSDTLWKVGDFTLEYTPTVSRSLFVLPGTFPLLDEDSQTIRQFIILLPAWFTGCCIDGSVETMIVTVCNDVTGCCDIDEVGITMMPLFLKQ